MFPARWLAAPLARCLDDADNLPAPEVLAAEIVEDLQAALEEFAAIAETLPQDPEKAPVAD